MSKLQPDFYVHTGDIEYMDKPFPYAMTEELMRFKWNRLFALPFQRSFYNNHTYWKSYSWYYDSFKVSKKKINN